MKKSNPQQCSYSVLLNNTRHFCPYGDLVGGKLPYLFQPTSEPYPSHYLVSSILDFSVKIPSLVQHLGLIVHHIL